MTNKYNDGHFVHDPLVMKERLSHAGRIDPRDNNLKVKLIE